MVIQKRYIMSCCVYAKVDEEGNITENHLRKVCTIAHSATKEVHEDDDIIRDVPVGKLPVVLKKIKLEQSEKH